jgi:hypothetical protein
MISLRLQKHVVNLNNHTSQLQQESSTSPNVTQRSLSLSLAHLLTQYRLKVDFFITIFIATCYMFDELNVPTSKGPWKRYNKKIKKIK